MFFHHSSLLLGKEDSLKFLFQSFPQIICQKLVILEVSWSLSIDFREFGTRPSLSQWPLNHIKWEGGQNQTPQEHIFWVKENPLPTSTGSIPFMNHNAMTQRLFACSWQLIDAAQATWKLVHYPALNKARMQFLCNIQLTRLSSVLADTTIWAEIEDDGDIILPSSWVKDSGNLAINGL